MAAGAARALVRVVDGQSAVVEQAASAPSKLLFPRPRGPAVWLCHLSFGGGLVAGDRMRLNLQLEAGSTALSSTQGATKIYKDPEQRMAQQELTATIGEGALLVQLPHPVTAYAGARYRQQTRFCCAPGGSVMWWDVLTAGRPDQGEHWSAHRVELGTELSLGDEVIARDVQRLEGDLSRQQLGPWRCVVTMGLFGPRCADAARALLAAPPVNGPQARWSLSPLGSEGEGCLLRGLTTKPELARETCRHYGQWLLPILDDDPWQRLL